jgi:ABC-type transporter Mla subunit MlaD
VTTVRNVLARYRVPLILGVIVVLAILSYRIVNGLTEYRLLVPLDSADGLYPGSDVLIAGAKAGSVRDIALDGGHSLVTIALDDAHAPVHSNARLTVRPKSLLGEKYVALEPGSGDSMASGSRLNVTQVARAVDLQDVVNTLDQPTREKLRTLLIELGGGLSGRGLDTNQTISFGRQDLDDLAAITDTLAARDADLQDAQLKRALAEAHAALGRTDTALSGTAGQLNGIFQQAPRTVDLLSALSADLGNGIDQTLKGDNLRTFDAGMKYTTNIFGAQDAQGYATRISVKVGDCSAGAPCLPPPGLLTNGTGPDSFDAVVGVLLGAAK